MIGRTPLVRLHQFERESPGVELYAKAEWQNPGGSVKDRAAARMILEGEASGRLTPDKIDHRRDLGQHRHRLRDGRRRARLPGHAVHAGEREPRAQADSARARRRADPDQSAREHRRRDPRSAAARTPSDPDRYFYPDQYNNDGNWRAHYDTTAPEIIEQTSGRLTHFVAGLGTSGTFIGTGRRLRKFNPGIKLISFQPDAPFHGLEGLKHMESAIVPGIYDPTLADEDLRIDTERAYRMVRRLAREEGLLAGISSGAAVAAMLDVAQRDRRGVIVTVFPDGAEKYLNETFWTLDE